MFAKLFGRKKGASQSENLDGSAARIKLTEAPEPKSPPVPDTRDKILFVDDDPVLCRLAAAKIESAGFAPVIAGDCSEAIGALADNRPAFIILDLLFPPDANQGGLVSWDGIRLMRWLKGTPNGAKAKYIIISGNETPEAQADAKKCGVLDFIPKPLDFERLLTVLRSQAAPAEPALA